jgi:glutamyl-tRNA synthetase
VPTGRFAPSPTGQLHVGNLRTALAARLAASATAGRFLVRFEDLDPVASRREVATDQLTDLAAIGVVPTEPPVWQSERFALYEEALDRLVEMDAVYECFCTRREIREAVAAPHGDDIVYPGTCRNLSSREREERRAVRAPAIRLRTHGEARGFHDGVHGTVEGPVSDIVLRRNDGLPAYNLAVVADDALQGVTEIVRGADLMAVTPTQILLRELLGHPPVAHTHVPLVVGPDGERLAKRHGAVTLPDLLDAGWTSDRLRAALLDSLGQGDSGPWDPGRVPRGRWRFEP